MRIIISALLLFTLVSVSLAGKKWSHVYYFRGCDDTSDKRCNPENNETINVIKDKDATSKFEICPKTSHLCQEINTTITINESELYIFDYGTLNVLQGGVFRLKQKSGCKVSERSLLEIDRDASAIVDNNSALTVTTRGELNNNGMIFVGEESVLYVFHHANLKIFSSVYNDRPAGLVHIDKSSEASICWYSTAEVAPESEIRVEKKGAFKAEHYSDVDVYYESKLIVEDASRVTVSDHSSLKLGSAFCSEPDKTQFLTRAGSKVFISASKIIIPIGQLVVDGEADLSLYDDSSIIVHGLLEVNDWDVRFAHGRKVVVGEQGRIDYEHCSSNASLIITNSAVLPKELIVLLGAHCFTKNTTGDISEEKFANATVQLKHDSDTSEFKCFNSRAELKAALVGFQRTPKPKHDRKITPRHRGHRWHGRGASKQSAF